MGVRLKRNAKDICRVKLMGVRTAEETLIIRTVNFTVYSFWIEYKNGTTETVEVSPQNPHDSFGTEKKLFDTLMTYANKEPTGATAPSAEPAAADSSSVLDELKKLKELFDDGVIPENLYEEKRAELLGQLKTQKNNVTILRANKRSWGEQPISTYIDSKEQYTDLSQPISLFLPEGVHILYFKHGSLRRSKELQITISTSKEYQINVVLASFSFYASVEEK